MNTKHLAIYDLLREFAVTHLTSHSGKIIIDPCETTAEIEELLQRIDQVRGIGEEPKDGFKVRIGIEIINADDEIEYSYSARLFDTDERTLIFPDRPRAEERVRWLIEKLKEITGR